MSIIDGYQLIRLHAHADFLAALDNIDINQRNDSGETLLHTAIAYGEDQIAMLLIRNGADANCRELNGMTPLHFVAAYSNIRLAKEILRAGGSLSIADKFGNMPLWTAVFNARGQYSLVKLFLESGADPRHRNNAGRSALDFATQINDAELESMLTAKA